MKTCLFPLLEVVQLWTTELQVFEVFCVTTVLCFIRMFWSSLFTSETVAWGKQHVVVVLLLMFLIMESPNIRVLGSAALWAECRCLLDLERLFVAMLAAGWFDPCLVTFGDSSPTFTNVAPLGYHQQFNTFSYYIFIKQSIVVNCRIFNYEHLKIHLGTDYLGSAWHGENKLHTTLFISIWG